MRIRGAVLREPAGPFGIEELELEEPGQGEALVRLEAVGVCHSDLLHRDGFPLPLPVVMGHEGAGVIERLGPGLDDFEVGDRVALSFDSCGRCRTCLSGRPAYCLRFIELNNGGGRLDGTVALRDRAGETVASHWFGQSSFASHCLATRRNMVRVDSSIPAELLAPMGCGIQTGAGAVLNNDRIDSGSVVAVVGAGAVGLSAVMAAAVARAAAVVAIDLSEARLELAATLGATAVLDARDPEVFARLLRETGGVDLVVDTTGVASVCEGALDVLAVGGELACIGAPRSPVSLTPTQLLGRTLTYLIEGGAVPQLFIPHLIDLWERGLLPVERLVTTYGFDDINDAVSDTLSGITVKPVLTF